MFRRMEVFKNYTVEVPQLRAFKDEEERTFLHQEQPGFPHVKKEEEEELCRSKEDAQLLLKQEIKSECDELFVNQFEDLSEKPIYRNKAEAEQLHWKQEMSSSLNEEKPELSYIKAEMDEHFIREEGKQLQLKQETDAFMVTEHDQERMDSKPESNVLQLYVCKEEKERTFLHQEQPEPPQIKKEEEELCCSQEQEQLLVKQEIKSECDELFVKQFEDLSEENIYRKGYDAEQLLWKQERISSLNEEEPELPQVKEEWEEVCISQEGEQFELKQETNASMVTEHDQEKLDSKPKPSESPVLEANTQIRDSDAVTVQLDTSSLRCETCGKVFTRRRNLNVHMKIHTGERPFSCEICEKGFIRRCQLQVHMRTHTGERPFTCEICEKGFTQSCQLQVHLRTHTGEKPYTCEICEKCFTKSFHLKVHMRTHTGERPYTCEICGKSYAQSSYLTVHMKTHNSDRSYTCKICKKSYTQSSYLTVHMKKAHT